MASSNLMDSWKMRITKYTWYVIDTHGVVVFAGSTHHSKESLFGITVSLDFFLANANKQIIEAFLEKLEAPRTAHKYQLVPMLVMKEDETWSLQFRENSAGIVSFFESLWESAEVSENCIKRFWPFTQRDGSLYYRKFCNHISYFQRCIHMYPNGVSYSEAKKYLLDKSIEIRLLRSMMEKVGFNFDLRKRLVTMPEGREFL